MSRTARALERLVIGLAALALSVGLIALLSGYFAGQDPAQISGSTPPPPGLAYPDLGHRRLAPGDPHPAYNSNPPTSGAFVPRRILRDRTDLSDDQLLQALARGDVVILYGGARPPRGLRTLADRLAPPFTPARAAAGQTVILGHRPGLPGIVAVAWGHLLPGTSAGDPALRTFVAYWLGRGSPGR